MGAHATREEEVDELLRGEVFVDLLQVVRQSLRAGVPNYSLKSIEQFFFTRSAIVKSGDDAVIAFERYLADRRRVAARRHRGLQRGGLPRHARAPRLAAGAEGRSRARVRRLDPVPTCARGARDLRGERGGAQRDRAAPRRPPRRRRRRRRALAGGAAPRLPPPRGSARLVVLLPPVRDVRRRPDRGFGGDRRARVGRARPGAGQEVARVHVLLPGAAAPLRRRRRRRGSGARGHRLDGVLRSTTRSARSCCGAGSRRPRAVCRPRLFRAGRTTRTSSAPRSAGSPRSILARRRALAGARSGPPARSAARRREGAAARNRRAARPRRRARRHVPVRPGAARLGQDLPRGADDRRPARRRQEGRHHLAEPQGDPQPARRGRGLRTQGEPRRSPGSSGATPRTTAATRSRRRTTSRRSSTRRRSSSPAPPGSSRARRWTTPSTCW